MFLCLAEVKFCGYHFRYNDSKPNDKYIGVPIKGSTWRRAKLQASPDTLFFVDENKRTVCLEDVIKEENYRNIYRIRTHKPHYPRKNYMYLDRNGTNIYFYNMYFNPNIHPISHARVKIRLGISSYVLFK